MAYSLASLPPHIRMFLQSRMASGQIDQNTLNMLLSGRIDLQSWLQQNGGPPLAGMPNRYPEQQNRDVTPQDPRTAQTTRVSGPAPIQPIQEMQRPGPIYGVEGTMTDAMRSNPDYQAAQQQMNMQPTPQMPEWMQFASALPNSPYGGPSGGGQTGPFSANLGTRI